MVNRIDISVIIPFYHGNSFIFRLLDSIKRCSECCKDKAGFEVLIINDSPEEQVLIPHGFDGMNIRIISNEHNMGIQKTRINGLRYANGEWVLFLDQDDELNPEGFRKQITLTKNVGMVIGNSIYEYSDHNSIVYKNCRVMRYYMRKNMFIRIRNLIPSPGECLIKRECIPSLWIENPMKTNGADDWLLWILIFNDKIPIAVNDKIVYTHHRIGDSNLSLNLEKMYISSVEMCEILKRNNCLSDCELKLLRGAIDYKYKRDNAKSKIAVDLENVRFFIYNVVYKIMTKLL